MGVYWEQGSILVSVLGTKNVVPMVAECRPNVAYIQPPLG